MFFRDVLDVRKAALAADKIAASETIWGGCAIAADLIAASMLRNLGRLR